MVIWGTQETPVGYDRICSMNLPVLLAFRYPELGLAETVILKLWVAVPRVLSHPFVGVA